MPMSVTKWERRVLDRSTDASTASVRSFNAAEDVFVTILFTLQRGCVGDKDGSSSVENTSEISLSNQFSEGVVTTLKSKR
jgi:hypothetical protein